MNTLEKKIKALEKETIAEKKVSTEKQKLEKK